MLPIRDNIPSKTTPIVNYALIAANLWVFAREISLGRHLDGFINQYGIVPAHWLPSSRIALEANLLPLVTSMFLHGGIMHVVSNLWTLYIFGDNVEDRMGHVRYLLFYLLSGIAAGIFHLATNWGSHVPTIGASGAIAGIMGAYFILFPHARVLTLLPLFFFFQTVEIPAVLFLGVWFLSQLRSGMASLGSSFGGIAWWAHIGGFGAGVLLVGKLVPKGRRRVSYEL
jgi:membrane associated rhomboid family serine protease